MNIKKVTAAFFALILCSNMSYASRCTEVLAKIESLNPGIEKNRLHYKISQLDNPFLFFISFVSFYYYIFKDIKAYSFLAELQKYKIVGAIDYHPDNFSFYPLKKGEVAYQMNDYDSANIVPAFTELVRYLSSLTLANDRALEKKLLFEYMEAYKKGLRAQKREIPNFLLDKIHSKNFSYEPEKKDIKKGKLCRELSKARVAVELSEEELQTLPKIMPKDARFIDAFKYYNITGGSGGLLRYRILLDFEDSSELQGLQVFELKQIHSGAINPLSKLENFSPLKIIDQLVRNDQYAQFYEVKELAGQSYLFRPRFNGLEHDGFLEYSEKKRNKIISLQVGIMGENHAYSLGVKVQEYLTLIENYEEEILDASNEMAQQMKFYYELLSVDEASP